MTWQACARHIVRLALLWLLPLGVVAMVVVKWQIDDRATRALCPSATPEAVRCLDGLEPSSLTLELAGSGQRLACQLHPVAAGPATSTTASASAPSSAERTCIAARVQTRRDELTQLDTRIFIPIYGLFSMLVAAWIALSGTASAASRRSLIAGAVIALLTGVLLWLDLLENRLALALLTDAEKGPLTAPHLTALDRAASAARDASLRKWGASAAWAAALAWGFFEWRGARRPWQRWPRQVAASAAGAAAIAFLWAVIAARDAQALAGPVQWLGIGFGLCFLAMFAAALVVWKTPTARALAAHDDPAPSQDDGAAPTCGSSRTAGRDTASGP